MSKIIDSKVNEDGTLRITFNQNIEGIDSVITFYRVSLDWKGNTISGSILNDDNGNFWELIIPENK